MRECLFCFGFDILSDWGMLAIWKCRWCVNTILFVSGIVFQKERETEKKGLSMNIFFRQMWVRFMSMEMIGHGKCERENEILC